MVYIRLLIHEWQQLLNSMSKGLGFIQLKNDACVYKLSVIDHNINGTLILGVFFDDILCLGTATRTSIIQWFQFFIGAIFDDH